MKHLLRSCALPTALLTALTVVRPLLAQDPASPPARTSRAGGIPREVVLSATRLFNAPGTRRVRGDFTLAAGDTVRGDVAVLGGRAQVDGVITGQLLVLNGSALVSGTCRIDGDLTVLGGAFESRERPALGGAIGVWSARYRYHEEADTLVADLDGEWIARWTGWQLEDPNGSKRQFFITTAHTYNRVEGLPILLGPRVRVRNGDTHVDAEAFGILRTSNQLDFRQENLGYKLRLELRQGRRAGVFVGGRLFDEVDAVEQWQLSDSEVGLATFVATRDYRDYWRRHGGLGYVGVFGPRGAELRASYGTERWGSRRMVDVPSLFNADVPWRNNPSADEGRINRLMLTATLDTRNRADNPRTGWLLQGEFEHGDGALDVVAPTTLSARPTIPGDVQYSRMFFDLRRYNRLGPSVQLNVRAVVGGWLSGDPLPLQRRLSVSGIDALPGFSFRQYEGPDDPGTCASGPVATYIALGRPAQCERMLLLQGEWKRDFRVDFGKNDGLGDRRWSAGRFRADGALVLFVNSGRGWLVGQRDGGRLRYPQGTLPPIDTWHTDAGGGFDFGSFGVYVAQAISESTRSPNVYVRLRRRF